MCVAEQSDGTRAENIPLLAFITRIEARDVEDVSATRLGFVYGSFVPSTEGFN